MGFWSDLREMCPELARSEEEMTELDKAVEAYEDHFDETYPLYTWGCTAKTDEEHIRTIRECIEKNTPVDCKPKYRPDCDY